jgi:hypothetical protein
MVSNVNALRAGQSSVEERIAITVMPAACLVTARVGTGGGRFVAVVLLPGELTFDSASLKLNPGKPIVFSVSPTFDTGVTPFTILPGQIYYVTDKNYQGINDRFTFAV